MSKFSRARDVAYGIRERYLWELLWPAENDPLLARLPTEFRSEMHDRLLAPIYPFFFAAVAFAFLGLARTTRQSRNFSMAGAVLVAFVVRLAGFALSVIANKTPYVAGLQYLLLFVATGTCASSARPRCARFLGAAPTPPNSGSAFTKTTPASASARSCSPR